MGGDKHFYTLVAAQSLTVKGRLIKRLRVAAHNTRNDAMKHSPRKLPAALYAKPRCGNNKVSDNSEVI